MENKIKTVLQKINILCNTDFEIFSTFLYESNHYEVVLEQGKFEKTLVLNLNTYPEEKMNEEALARWMLPTLAKDMSIEND